MLGADLATNLRQGTDLRMKETRTIQHQITLIRP